MNWSEALRRSCPQCGASAAFRCQGKRGERKAHHRARYKGVKASPYAKVRVPPFRKCESPIERSFIETWFHTGERTRNIFFGPPDQPNGVFVEQQYPFGPYRLDFYLTWMLHGKPFSIGVELDGHDFHERTKEQARHDKRRDRYCASEGLTVLRFTGSEVYADVHAVVVEVIEYMAKRRGK